MEQDEEDTRIANSMNGGAGMTRQTRPVLAEPVAAVASSPTSRAQIDIQREARKRLHRSVAKECEENSHFDQYRMCCDPAR